MSDALDMFWCDKCDTYYVPVEHEDKRIRHMCNVQTVVGPRFFSDSRGNILDLEV